MFKKIINFGIIGIIATSIDFLLLFSFVSILHINIYISTILAFSIALVFNYLASMRYVFVAKENISIAKQSGIFLFTAVGGLLINQFFMFLGVAILQTNYLITKFIATFFSMAFNFITRKHLLEK
jgi:Predicted membrane protein